MSDILARSIAKKNAEQIDVLIKNDVFPGSNVVIFDNITVGNFVLTRDMVQLGTINLA